MDEGDRTLWTLVLVTLAALAAGLGAHRWGHELAGLGERLRLRGAQAAAVVGAAASGYALFMARLTIAQHHGLRTHVADLGYYDNIFYQSSRGRLLGCSFMPQGYHGAAHFDPILILLSPLHRLYPRAEMLLVLQSVWLASGAAPVYLLARRVLGGRCVPVVLALSYLAYPALAGANAFDFHSLTLAVPPLLWMAVALEAGSMAGFVGALGVTLACREDLGLLVAFVGGALLLVKRPHARRMGGIALAVGLGYFAVARALFMPAVDAADASRSLKTYSHYYADLLPEGGGPLTLIGNVIARPALALSVVMREAKLVFLLQLFVPLAFAPLLPRAGRAAMIYGLAFCLLASRPAVFDIHFQYSTVLFPVAIALVPYGLRRIREGGLPGAGGPAGERVFRGWVVALAVASALCAWKFGPFVPNGSFRAGPAPLVRSLSDEQQAAFDWLRAQVARIPEHASVGASMRMGPHVSSRMRAHLYPDVLDVDWVLLDESETVGEGLGAHHRAVRSGALVEVARRGRLVLFERRR